LASLQGSLAFELSFDFKSQDKSSLDTNVVEQRNSLPRNIAHHDKPGISLQTNNTTIYSNSVINDELSSTKSFEHKSKLTDKVKRKKHSPDGTSRNINLDDSGKDSYKDGFSRGETVSRNESI